MKVTDYKLPKSVNVRVRQMLDEITQILNEGEYESKITSTAPATGDPGYNGEERIVVTGATMRVYKYADGKWWYSELYSQA